MLNVNALSQLKQLKQDIHESMERSVAKVKGTQRNFGFAVLDDGREIFLTPDTMQRVFPGDTIKIAIQQGKEGKPVAELEKLLESPVKAFCGRYRVKGKGHFVEPDLPQFNRWIFIPPNDRLDAKPGDLISCSISRHPFKSGKPQAKIERVIGATDKPGIEADYVIAKFQLPLTWPSNWQGDIIEPKLEQRRDLSNLPFVTIDNAETQDMDDALYIESDGDTWQLYIAIADPTAFIPSDSALEQAIQIRANSVYLPGKVQTMLPRELANQQCSLVAGQIRPALICQMIVNHQGQIQHTQLYEAKINVQEKFSYQQVSDVLTANDPELPNVEIIRQLQACSQALLDQRINQHLVMDDKPDFYFRLNQQGKIDQINRNEKNQAHTLVEECMIAANRCAADFLGDSGLFIEHAGFRPEKIPTAASLAEQHLGYSLPTPVTLNDYIELIRLADKTESDLPIKSILTRWLQRSELSATPKAHYGMGLNVYTNFTSPIRKYSDFLVHRLIKAKLNNEEAPLINEQCLSRLMETQSKGRQAKYEMERWLHCQHLLDQKGQTKQGKVTQVNSHGFTVRLNESGIDGFVETRQLEGKYSFDPITLTLTHKERKIQLDQEVTVQIGEINCEQRNINYQLVIDKEK